MSSSTTKILGWSATAILAIEAALMVALLVRGPAPITEHDPQTRAALLADTATAPLYLIGYGLAAAWFALKLVTSLPRRTPAPQDGSR